MFFEMDYDYKIKSDMYVRICSGRWSDDADVDFFQDKIEGNIK